MRETGLAPLFPIWGIPTDVLARDMVTAGLRARLTCIDPGQVPATFAGRDFDQTLLADLAALHPDVDPCGERGEFHSFAVRRADVQAGGADSRRARSWSGTASCSPTSCPTTVCRVRNLARREREAHCHGRLGLPRDLSAG